MGVFCKRIFTFGTAEEGRRPWVQKLEGHSERSEPKAPSASSSGLQGLVTATLLGQLKVQCSSQEQNVTGLCDSISRAL